jgi:hypothetical protein
MPSHSHRISHYDPQPEATLIVTPKHNFESHLLAFLLVPSKWNSERGEQLYMDMVNKEACSTIALSVHVLYVGGESNCDELSKN